MSRNCLKINDNSKIHVFISKFQRKVELMFSTPSWVLILIPEEGVEMCQPKFKEIWMTIFSTDIECWKGYRDLKRIFENLHV